MEQRPELGGWLDDLRGHGRVARAATLAGLTEEALLERVLEVVGRLPAPGVLGDAHALDAGRPSRPWCCARPRR